MLSIITAYTKVLKTPSTSKDEITNARAHRTLLAAAEQTELLSLGIVHCLFPLHTLVQKRSHCKRKVFINSASALNTESFELSESRIALGESHKKQAQEEECVMCQQSLFHLNLRGKQTKYPSISHGGGKKKKVSFFMAQTFSVFMRLLGYRIHSGHQAGTGVSIHFHRLAHGSCM